MPAHNRSPHIIDRIFSDFAKDIRLALKFSRNDNQLQLESNVESAGLTNKEPRAPADGNCMYHTNFQLRVRRSPSKVS